MELLKSHKTILLTIILVGFSLFEVRAQKMAVRLGDSNFRDYNFPLAVEYYEYAFSRDSSDHYVIRRLAEANNNMGKTDQVEKWLRILVRQGAAEGNDLYLFSQSLKSNGKYTEAQKHMLQYAALHPDDARIMMEVSMLEYIQFLLRDSLNFSIRNVSTNTPGSDMGPAFYKDKLIFSSTSLGTGPKRTYSWNQLPYLDLYEAQIADNGDLRSPKPFAPKLKTNYHDGPLVYDEKNDRIFYTRNNFAKGRAQKSQEGVVNLKTYFAKNGAEGWEYNGSFRFNSDEYSVGHPSIDTTGNVLYFASDMPGGYGGSDIYFSIYAEGRWSTPFNLGPKVNTAGNELFPFISNDGVLYFSSNGHGGIGGLDIFFSVPENGVFNSIENMGYPVNSPKDDFALSLDKSCMKGYFTSNRSNGKGDDDIYFVKIARIPVIIRGTVRDRISEEVIGNASLALVNSKGDTISSSISRANGAFEFELNKGENYTMVARKISYSEDKRAFTTMGLRPNQEIELTLYLETILPQQEPIAAEQTPENYPEPLKMEEENGEQIQVLELEYINYDLDKWNIRTDAAEIFDRLAALMLEYPDLEIRLESHTDSRGGDDYNLLLSKRRARSAFEYLVERGIEPTRIQYEGYGETRLLNKCSNGVECTEEEHEVNRRTIVKVIRKGEYRRSRGQRGIFYF